MVWRPVLRLHLEERKAVCAGQILFLVMSARRRLQTVQGHTLTLTPQQHRDYEELGFIVIRRLVPEQDMQPYIQRLYDIAKMPRNPVPSMTIMRDITQRKKKVKEDDMETA